MAKPATSDASRLLRQTAARLHDLADDADAGEDVRARLAEVIGSLRADVAREFGPRPRASRGKGAKHQILEYLLERPGQEVSGEELAAASGIQEWARRVRELRVEDGYRITELGGSRYRLESPEPDREAARQWKFANHVRRRQGGARDRILVYLKGNVGQTVTRDQIDYVGRIAEGIRRVRELRDEYGWPIESNIDDPNLRPGEYRLVSAEEDDKRDLLQRLYPEDLRHRVFERDRFTCQDCGRDKKAAEAAGDTRFYLEVHHKVAIAEDLEAMPADERNLEENLVTLCHSCHRAETAKFHEARRRSRRGEG